MKIKIAPNFNACRGTLLYLANKNIKWLVVAVLSFSIFYTPCLAEDDQSEKQVPPPVLKQAVLCEKLINNNTKPVNEGVVFSSSLGGIFCFTEFDPVYEDTVIYHNYYFKDKFVSPKRLELRRPRWATYSEIHLRESDKGPWRVEITDADGSILSTIRFSITD